MEFSLNKETFANPLKRFLFGVLILIISIVVVFVSGQYAGVTKENCLQVEAVFDKCKSRSSQTSEGHFTYYLVLEDNPSEYIIHPSFEHSHLVGDLLALRSGTPVTLLVDEKSGTIYELVVDGETWLPFDEAKKSIDKNMVLARYIAYVCAGVGGICILSAGVSALFLKKKRTPDAIG
ncbi:MAG: hypothetical protein IJN11_08020 [Oscillospiraceae bacterium]|nr:hypothetical protein [Oscillospiraceae bacterium]MBQ7013841.1 hypothetical protein [Oscillospiraceae bacterium]